jgi:hypothetical protein
MTMILSSVHDKDTGNLENCHIWQQVTKAEIFLKPQLFSLTRNAVSFLCLQDPAHKTLHRLNLI